MINFASTIIRRVFVFTVMILGLLNLSAADSGVVQEQTEEQLRVTWPISTQENGVAVFSLDETKPLIESLGLATPGQPPTVVLKALNPVTRLTVGSRAAKNPQGSGAFFDKPSTRPYKTFLVALGERRVHAADLVGR